MLTAAQAGGIDYCGAYEYFRQSYLLGWQIEALEEHFVSRRKSRGVREVGGDQVGCEWLIPFLCK